MNASINQMRVAEVLFKNCPNLIKTEESVEKLIMRDVVDFDTGMNLVNNIKAKVMAKAQGIESEDTVPADFSSGVTFPSITDNVVFNTVLELTPSNEKESMLKLLDELNLQFETAFKKRKEDIIRVVSSVVEINETDADVASDIMKSIKADQYVLIKK
jgi:hypothetical protein